MLRAVYARKRSLRHLWPAYVVFALSLVLGTACKQKKNNSSGEIPRGDAPTEGNADAVSALSKTAAKDYWPESMRTDCSITVTSSKALYLYQVQGLDPGALVPDDFLTYRASYPKSLSLQVIRAKGEGESQTLSQNQITYQYLSANVPKVHKFDDFQNDIQVFLSLAPDGSHYISMEVVDRARFGANHPQTGPCVRSQRGKTGPAPAE